VALALNASVGIAFEEKAEGAAEMARRNAIVENLNFMFLE
jgi:hypothetical protein